MSPAGGPCWSRYPYCCWKESEDKIKDENDDKDKNEKEEIKIIETEEIKPVQNLNSVKSIKKKNWWKLARDFVLLYNFMLTSKKYVRYALKRNRYIKDRYNSLENEIDILKEFLCITGVIVFSLIEFLIEGNLLLFKLEFLIKESSIFFPISIVGR